MSSPTNIMECFALLRNVMQRAHDGTLDAAGIDLDAVRSALSTRRSASCDTLFTALCAAVERGDRLHAWSLSWQLMAALPYGYPPALETCPPPPDTTRSHPVAQRHCDRDIPPEAGFCPWCGQRLDEQADARRHT